MSNMAIAYNMKKRKMAEGGMAMDCPDCSSGSCMKHSQSKMADGGMARDDGDLVERIMKKRGMYSEGGRVANEDHGPDDDRLADFSPNEFDDLSLKDDLESSYTGKNSGDLIGDEQEDEDRDDIVSRIMKSRKLKDRMPIAGYGSSYGRDK